jgi:phosphoribosylformylglycinamidine synthase
MKIGILRFLGTNSEFDVEQAVKACGGRSQFLWFEDRFDFKEFQALILPGGFANGDYLRCGALAARAPAMQSVREAAEYGLPILGICNGFQILCESGLLPGALLRNEKGRFIDRWASLRAVTQSPFFPVPEDCVLPVDHGEGRYFVKPDELKSLYDHNQVWLTYEDNPNGSIDSIAGVMSQNKNVAALMPHPDRAFADWMGHTSGLAFFSKVCV